MKLNEVDFLNFVRFHIDYRIFLVPRTASNVSIMRLASSNLRSYPDYTAVHAEPCNNFSTVTMLTNVRFQIIANGDEDNSTQFKRRHSS